MINEFKLGADAGTRRASDNLYHSQGGPGIRLVIPVRIPIRVLPVRIPIDSYLIPARYMLCPLWVVGDRYCSRLGGGPWE